MCDEGEIVVRGMNNEVNIWFIFRQSELLQRKAGLPDVVIYD